MQTKLKKGIFVAVVFLALLVVFSFNNQVFSSDTSATSPSTVANVAGVGSTNWTNPTNATASDNVYATVGLDDEYSTYLQATNFGFSIPSDATINGVTVEIERKSIASNQNKDTNVKLVKGGVIGGNNKADTSTFWTTSDAYITYGASNDLWGLSLTAADVNSSDFGVVLSVYGASNYRTGYVDHIRMTISYTSSGGSATASGQGIIWFE